jgi:electron transfer flavoprotein alpha subunit
MSILVYANTAKNEVHKSAYEVVSYGSQLAQKTGESVTALVIGEASNISTLENFGADKIIHLKNDKLSSFQPSLLSKAINQIAKSEDAKTIVFSHDLTGKAIASMVAASAKAGIVTGAVAIPETENGFIVKKAVFSGKAYAHVKINTETKVISVNPNSIEKVENKKSTTISEGNVDLGESRINVIEQKIESTDVPLTEAERVVSAGRGLKGPENWGMIEELAKELGAATACSRPVSDMDWRPHHEHVGQTGVAIRPNLYIAVGISGAIQHLAGVNQSKVIVAINTDPEAPFFKSADYGIVGDAFEVVPKLIEAAKAMNN